MKKILALLLVLAMLLSFGGCGKRSNKIAEEIVREVDQMSDSEIEALVGDFASAENEDSDYSTTDFSLGEAIEDKYENEYIGIGFELPDDDWFFYDENQMEELNGIAMDVLSDEYREMLEASTVIYAMFAQGRSGDNININYEKLNGAQTVLNEEQYITIATPTVEDSLRSAGAQNLTSEATTVSIDGETFNALNLNYVLQGVDVYQTIIAIKKDEYIANITVTSIGGDVTDDLISYLYIVD